MSVQKHLSPKFDLQVAVTYIAAESRPEQNQFFFAYKIRIINNSTFAAQLMSRHWIITDSFGMSEEVRGAGVIGLQPRLTPGQSFEYESACPLTTASGSMRGFYQMISDSGEQFEITIPEFYLVAPQALH